MQQQELQAGTLLNGGAYRIITKLGQGGFGITYLAQHTILNKKVAIKEFFMKELNARANDGSIIGLTEGSMSYNYSRKFKKEAQKLASMDHPNIIRVTDSFVGNGTFYYAMEYIEGQNLKDYLEVNALSESEAISIIKDIANALIYMHEEKHMLHLDLKPGNIMRRKSDGHIYLIDFGLSKYYEKDGESFTSTTAGFGTIGYAPIEQGNNVKEEDLKPTIDVYALGATLYKLLTRETPPPASDVLNNDNLLAKKLNDKAVSPHLTNLIVMSMRPGAKARIQTVREFLTLLTTSCNSTKPEQPISNEETVTLGDNSNKITEETVTTAPDTMPTEEEPETKSNTAMIVGISVFVIVLIATVIGIRGCGGQTEQTAIAEDTIDTVSVMESVANQAKKKEPSEPKKTEIKSVENNQKKSAKSKPSRTKESTPSSNVQRIDRNSGSNHQSAADVLKSMQE